MGFSWDVVQDTTRPRELGVRSGLPSRRQILDKCLGRQDPTMLGSLTRGETSEDFRRYPRALHKLHPLGTRSSDGSATTHEWSKWNAKRESRCERQHKMCHSNRKCRFESAGFRIMIMSAGLWQLRGVEELPCVHGSFQTLAGWLRIYHDRYA